MIATTTSQIIEVQDFDNLVQETYGRPYSFQQQDGCKERGHEPITVPEEFSDDFENETLSEKVQTREMGVSFKAWLERDPTQKLSNPDDQADYCLELWWERNFFPDVNMVINDLHNKGLLPAGKYIINIDW